MEKKVTSKILGSCRIAGVIFLCFILWINPAFSDSYGKNLYKSLAKRLSNDRENYNYLTDSEFANFREVRVSGIARGKLYRSSSPVSSWGKRNFIADSESKSVGIKTFINLSDTNQGTRNYKDFDSSYYAGQKFIALNMDMKLHSKNFQQRLARGIKFMIENEPPFLIHCHLGKDRTGFVCALIECLTGAEADEIELDYMRSFYNYFGISKGSKEYEYIFDNEIKANLSRAFNIKPDDFYNANLKILAEKYFLNIGINISEIEKLRELLSENGK